MPKGVKAHTNGDGWPEEKIEALKRLHAEGLSMAEISKRIPGTSRNSCIGKIARLGLAQTTSQKPKSVEHKPTFKKPAALKPVAAPPYITSDAHEHMSPTLKRVAVIKALAAVTPPMRTTPAPVVQRGQCKFPIGDPQAPDFRFCENAAEQGPYCSEHYRICHPGNHQVLRERALDQHQRFGPKFGAGFVDSAFDAG